MILLGDEFHMLGITGTLASCEAARWTQSIEERNVEFVHQ